MEVKSLADVPFHDTGTVDIYRGSEVLTFSVRPITQGAMESIDEKYPDPPVPIQPVDATGLRLPNPSDPAYLEAVAKVQATRNRACILAGLDIDLPGEKVDDKWASLAERCTVGEIGAISDAIWAMTRQEPNKVDDIKKSSTPPPDETKTETPT